jgi:hypothetical protein
MQQRIEKNNSSEAVFSTIGRLTDDRKQAQNQPVKSDPAYQMS